MWRPNMSNFVVLLNKTQLRDRITIFSHNRRKIFLTQKKMKMHEKLYIEFVNDANDYIYILVIFLQFCLILRKKICKTMKKLKHALQHSLKKKPKKVVNEYSSVNMPTFFPNLFTSRPEINSCNPTISGKINYNPTTAIQTEARIPMEIVQYYACSCKGKCTTCGCAVRQQKCTKFCHNKSLNENCSRMNN